MVVVLFVCLFVLGLFLPFWPFFLRLALLVLHVTFRLCPLVCTPYASFYLLFRYKMYFLILSNDLVTENKDTVFSRCCTAKCTVP